MSNDVVQGEVIEVDFGTESEIPQPELPKYHTVLQVWREILKHAGGEKDKKVTPGWAINIVSRHPIVELGQMNEFRTRYFGKLEEFFDILVEEIESDDECLNYSAPDDDVENNSPHYKNLIFRWNVAILTWEQAWECTDEFAGVEIAAIAEAQRMIFEPGYGIVGYLDTVGFQFTEDDQRELQGELEALKEGK